MISWCIKHGNGNHKCIMCDWSHDNHKCIMCDWSHDNHKCIMCDWSHDPIVFYMKIRCT